MGKLYATILAVLLGLVGLTNAQVCSFNPDLYPTALGGSYGATSFTFEFEPVAGAEGYIILLDANPGEEYEYGYLQDGQQYSAGQYIEHSLVAGTTTESIFTYEGISVGNSYEVYIQPYYLCEGSVFYGDWGGLSFDNLEPAYCTNSLEYYCEELTLDVAGASIEVTFSPVEEASGYIVLLDDYSDYDENSHTFGQPSDGESHHTGDLIGDSKVVYTGTDTHITIEELKNNTEYRVSVYPFFDCDSRMVYGLVHHEDIVTPIPTGLNNYTMQALSLYPNPTAENEIHIRLPEYAEGQANIQIFDISGTRVFDAEQNIFSDMKLNIPPLPNGRYTLRIFQHQNSQTGAFILMR